MPRARHDMPPNQRNRRTAGDRYLRVLCILAHSGTVPCIRLFDGRIERFVGQPGAAWIQSVTANCR